MNPRAEGKNGWAAARRILCIRLDTLGDVLMTTPAIRAIKTCLAGSQITLLTSPRGMEPAKYIPEVDAALEYEAPWMKASPARANSQYDQAMIERLRGQQFDGAVIFSVYSQNPLPAALLCYLANIPLRTAHCRENPYHLLTDWVKETEPEQGIRHEVQRQLDLVENLGFITQNTRLSFHVPQESRCRAGLRILAEGIDLRRPWMVIHPGVSASSRQYPPEGYAQAARRLVEEDGMQVVFTGTKAEIDLVEGVRQEMGAPSVSLAGEINLGELGAVLEQAALLLTNNTGPVHVAAAVGTPVVDLYALTNPQHTPWQVPARVLNHDVPCKFCYKSVCPEGHHNCLRLVSPSQVVEAVRDLLRESGRHPTNTQTGASHV